MSERNEVQQEGQQSFSFWRQAFQGIGIFLIIQFGLKQFLGNGGAFGQTKQNQPGVPAVPGASDAIPAFADRPSPSEYQGEWKPVPSRVAPIWSLDSSIDLDMYVSASLAMPPVDRIPRNALVLREKGLKLSEYDDKRDIHTTIDVPKEVQNMGQLWAHFYVARSGSDVSSNSESGSSYHFVQPLNQFLKKKREVKARNLLSEGSASDAPEEEKESKDNSAEDSSKPTLASYYHPNFTLSIVPNTGIYDLQKAHPAAKQWLQLESTGARDVSGQNGWYYPILYLNTFWQLRDHMTELNTTVTTLPLYIHLNRLPSWQFSLISSLDFGIKQNAAKVANGETLPGGSDGSEMEEVKRIILDSNIYLLSTTVVVGLFHTLFEMLAFKSDVSHWRNKKDNVGVSVRTILANVVMQTVIFLYLMDNNDNTSWMILLGQGMGILVEAWKITKTVNVRVRPTPADSTALPWKYLPYTVVFEDKHKLSETEEKTKEYDEIAFTYLYWVAVPLLLAYAAYSLVYETHKSWYSFIIATLVGSVYAYGFLMMVPSLYINYRLQSVAHIPGKALTYKFLNTFIDDLFAFTVKMPLLHRLATLRDDVIFFFYLYQSWKYKVDYTRVNEFGQGGEDEDVAEKKATQPLKSAAGGDANGASPAMAVDDAGEHARASGRAGGGGKKRK
ncbi:MAG: hypothetical protein M1831_001867 [Alyxoria varia]|nr:MAG: hypothetical protein M1831_001867 [Alyxoria varia]